MLLTGIESMAGTDAGAGYHPNDFWSQPRTIWMKRPATGEEIKTVYWADGQLIQEEYKRLCWFMRDVRMESRMKQYIAKGQAIPQSLYCAVPMRLVLLDILYATNGWLDYHNISRPLILNSGLRHPITNAGTEGSARNSRHQVGGAGDITIAGVSSGSVSSYGRWLSAGGVGWYPGKSFTHIDDGRLRSWKG